MRTAGAESPKREVMTVSDNFSYNFQIFISLIRSEKNSVSAKCYRANHICHDCVDYLLDQGQGDQCWSNINEATKTWIVSNHARRLYVGRRSDLSLTFDDFASNNGRSRRASKTKAATLVSAVVDETNPTTPARSNCNISCDELF